MSPFLSTARLGMNRCDESGDHVDCWRGLDAIVPAVTGSSYQRTCAWLASAPPPTVWVSQSDSRPFRFVYWFCIINRYESVSRALPGDASGTSDGPALNAAMPTFVGPVNVELAVFVQSTWNFQTRTAKLPQIEAK